jgi:hypothetical protein
MIFPGCAAEEEEPAPASSSEELSSLCRVVPFIGEQLGYKCAVWFWGQVKDRYFDPRGLTVSGRWVMHSLERNPADLTSDDEFVRKVRKDSAFRAMVEPHVAAAEASFVVESPANFQFDDSDLRLSLGHVAPGNVRITGQRGPAGDYALSVVVKDVYDFDWKAIPLTDLRTILTYLGNDQAKLDQNYGYITPFDVNIAFSATWPAK